MSNSTVTAAPAAPKKKRGQAAEVWRRFRRNKMAMAGLVVIALLVLVAIFADVLAPGDGRNPGYDMQDFRARQLPSTLFLSQEELEEMTIRNRLPEPLSRWDFPMGTDHLGRDILSRIIHGSRITLQIGFLVVGISAVLGTILGLIAGYYGGIRDNVIMRLIDILLAIPMILLAISIVLVLGQGLYPVMIAVGINSIPAFARLVRASTLSLREQEFVEAARSVGSGDIRIMFRHILPNCLGPIIINSTMGMAGAVLSAAALSFLGLGIQLPLPEWGAMLNDGRRFIMEFPHIVFWPGFVLAVVVLAINLMGDGLRDAFDPRLKK